MFYILIGIIGILIQILWVWIDSFEIFEDRIEFFNSKKPNFKLILDKETKYNIKICDHPKSKNRYYYISPNKVYIWSKVRTFHFKHLTLAKSKLSLEAIEEL